MGCNLNKVQGAKYIFSFKINRFLTFRILYYSKTNGILVGPNPTPRPVQDVIDPPRARPSSGNSKTKNRKAIIIGGVGGGIVLALVIGFLIVAASRHPSSRAQVADSLLGQNRLQERGGWG